MQEEVKPLVSIIIPCYNSGKFVGETIHSVLSQPYRDIEVLFINDGSTDNSGAELEKFSDKRIHYITKKNTGVSDSRNMGLRSAKGKYVVFLDADDILSADFIEKRVGFLEQNSQFGFCCSQVIKIDGDSKVIPEKTWLGASDNILEEVLSFNPEIITCPSNYMLRKDILEKNNLLFNTELSSSADRYFLIELTQYTKGKLISDGPLYYRMHENSMSHNFTKRLLNDNILFQKKILEIKTIPASLKREFCFKTNYIFAGSYLKLKKFVPCIFFSCKAFYYSPTRFIKHLFNR
jgi:teichuronic acid biosynthesis glycosyltransferase TuaG